MDVKKKYGIMAGLVLLIGLSACTNDLGTYDYQQLNTITIDTLMPQQVQVFETLHLEANIHQSHYNNDDNIAYTWYYYPDASETRCDTVGHERVLNYHIAIPPGDYTFYFTATDRQTGLWQKRSFKVSVTGQFSGGLLMLGRGKNDVATLSFVSLSSASRGKVVSIYDDQNGAELGQHPVMLSESRQEVFALCADEQGGSALLKGTMLRSKKFEELFMFRPQTMRPTFHAKVSNPFSATRGNTELAIVGGNAHFRKPDSDLFSPPLSGEHEFCSDVYMMRNNIIAYDNRDKRFMRCDFGIFGDAVALDRFPQPEEAYTAFDPNNLGMNALCLRMGRTTNSSLAPSICGIFQNNSGALYAVYLGIEYTFSEGMLAQPHYIEQIGEDRLPGFLQATAFGGYDSNSSILYYAVGTKLYKYDFDTKLPASVVFDLTQQGFEGYHVTAMTNDKVLMGDMVTHTGHELYLALAHDDPDASSNTGAILHLKLSNDDSGRIASVADVWRNTPAPIVSLLEF